MSVGIPADGHGEPVRATDPPGTTVTRSNPNAGGTATANAIGTAIGTAVSATANGLTGRFVQIANMTAVGVGLAINVMLIVFLTTEIRSIRSESLMRESRIQQFYSDQATQQRLHDSARTESILARLDSLISETRAAQAETRTSRVSMERAEKVLIKYIEGMGIKPHPERPKDDDPDQ